MEADNPQQNFELPWTVRDQRGTLIQKRLRHFPVFPDFGWHDSPLVCYGRVGYGHVIPSAFIAAVIGSAKEIGSTHSITSPETSRKLIRLGSLVSMARYSQESLIIFIKSFGQPANPIDQDYLADQKQQ
jgi:hypothetical protein